MKFDIRIGINSGAALILFLVSFFLMLWMAQHHEAIERLYPVALGGLLGAFSGYLIKRNQNNKIELEAGKAGVTMSGAVTK